MLFLFHVLLACIRRRRFLISPCAFFVRRQWRRKRRTFLMANGRESQREKKERRQRRPTAYEWDDAVALLHARSRTDSAWPAALLARSECGPTSARQVARLSSGSFIRFGAARAYHGGSPLRRRRVNETNEFTGANSAPALPAPACAQARKTAATLTS